jgi:hypothetical protein
MISEILLIIQFRKKYKKNFSFDMLKDDNYINSISF